MKYIKLLVVVMFFIQPNVADASQQLSCCDRMTMGYRVFVTRTLGGSDQSILNDAYGQAAINNDFRLLRYCVENNIGSRKDVEVVCNLEKISRERLEEFVYAKSQVNISEMFASGDNNMFPCKQLKGKKKK